MAATGRGQGGAAAGRGGRGVPARSASGQPQSSRRSASQGRGRSGVRGAQEIVASEGRRFYVQIERCCSLGEKTMSVRQDTDKYARISKGIKDGIEGFFDRQLLVDMVDVATPYAMEIRLMSEHFHSQHGTRYTGKDAEVAAGARTVFSKIESKKWPKLESILESLMDMCRIPVYIALLGRDVHSRRGSNASQSRAILGEHENRERRPSAGYGPDGNFALQTSETVLPLPHVVLCCVHATSGVRSTQPVITDAEGNAVATLFPGSFTLACEEHSNYDRLSPSMLSVPACFDPIEVSITASMKKSCTLLIVDHLNKPFPRFPVKLLPRDQGAHGAQVLNLRTKLDGRCKCRLGRGVFIATYDEENAVNQNMPVEMFTQELEVQDTDLPQLFRIVVYRTRFAVEIVLKTHFGVAPTHVPFIVRTETGEAVCTDKRSTQAGLAIFDVPPGRYTLRLEPSEDSPFVQAVADIVVDDKGIFNPTQCKVETKNVDIRIYLVTPDGQPAPNCLFHLSPQFPEGPQGGGAARGAARAIEMAFRTDADGMAMATMGLLEPYVFKVKNSGKVMEYMPQLFAFQTDRRSFTAVVARAILGHIPEENVALVVDASGSMQVYIEDIKVALNSTLVQQFHKSSKSFNIVSFSDRQVMFRPNLVESTPPNVEDAMRFCESIEAGGGSDATRALENVFSFEGIDAIYLITDGKCELGDALLNRLRALFFSHPRRPKLHTVGINCWPRGPTWRGLGAIAALTQAHFRPVCLEQDTVDPVSTALRRPELWGGTSGGPSQMAPGPLDAGLSTLGLDMSVPPVPMSNTEDEFTGDGGEDTADGAYDSD